MVGTLRYVHVYLSPHLDDAVLSCGGRIWEQVQAKESVLVITIFAGAPQRGAALSPFARVLHARWGQASEAVEQRREEDRAALAVLGAEVVHWPYKDCIYRRTSEGDFLYDSEEALWGGVHPAEEDLLGELVDRLTELPLTPDGALYVPLGVGGHVDHQLTRRAIERARGAVTYYEDYPYAEDCASVGVALGDRRWEAEVVRLSEEALEAKIAAIACYRSQISSLWMDTMDMVGAVRSFAKRRGAGRPAERYWLPVQSA